MPEKLLLMRIDTKSCLMYLSSFIFKLKPGQILGKTKQLG
jgi:hypothetical protein